MLPIDLARRGRNGRCPARGVDRLLVGWDVDVRGERAQGWPQYSLLFLLGVKEADGNKAFILKHS